MPWFSHDFVCCAIPLYNVGIYSILAETFVVALTTGVLCFATPSIIAVSIPSFGAYLLGALCIIIAVMQTWGFWAVYNEKSRPYRLFVRSTIAVTALAFILALVWIALSFAKHSTAVNACLSQFVAPGQNISTVSGQDLCNVFMWIQAGLLLFMWFFVAFAQAYFFTMMRIYGSEQRSDHAKYNSVYSTLGDEIALRNSLDQQKRGLLGGHERQESSTSTKVSASGLRNEVYADNVPATKERYNDPFAEPNDLRSRGRDDRSAVSAYSRSAHHYPPAAGGYSNSNISTARTAREPMQSYRY